MRGIWPLNPATYARHRLHREDRAWPESNCYLDLWVELLHTSGLEPLAVLPFTFTVDIEGDQWTFVKVPLADLYALYGVEVIELNVWRPLIAHIEEQLASARPAIVEVDAFYLPDTAGTSYHADHVKTSIAVQALDASARRIGYFHNAGYFELEGPDFAGLFNLEQADRTFLPPYVEIAKFHARAPREDQSLVATSIDLLRAQLGRRPHDNPFCRYAERFPADLELLAAESPMQFHGYAFATFRQCGAAFELAGTYLRWLQAHGEDGLDEIASVCDVLATTVKALQFKTARFVQTKRSFNPTPLLDTMVDAWEETFRRLAARYGRVVPA